jgi:hypothetical protein
MSLVVVSGSKPLMARSGRKSHPLISRPTTSPPTIKPMINAAMTWRFI